MQARGRLLAVAAITASTIGLGGGSVQGAGALIGKWRGALQVTNRSGKALPRQLYTLWIRSTKPASKAGKSVDDPPHPCVGRVTALGTSRGWTCFPSTTTTAVLPNAPSRGRVS